MGYLIKPTNFVSLSNNTLRICVCVLNHDYTRELEYNVHKKNLVLLFLLIYEIVPKKQ